MIEERTPQLPFKNPSMVSYRSAIVFAILSLAVGFAAGVMLFSSKGAGAGGVLGAPEGVDLTPIWRAWRAIDEKFVPASVASTTRLASSTEEANQERVWGMIAGLADPRHAPYPFFLPPKEHEIFEEDISGEFQGVGMEIAVRDEVLTIVSPLKGTPAERAGLKSADKVLKIDDRETRGMDISTAVSLIRGPKGSTVELLIMREGFSEPREFAVVRDVINVPILTTTTREDGIFIIELQSFTGNSTMLFRNALREFVESRSSRLILDLRGNPGGYLEAAVEMASWFLPSGKVVVTEDYAGHAENIVHRSRGYDIFNENLKMVILVDRGSASASEILAGALRHYGVAQMVGDRTFGKGSVQELIDITKDTALKLTVARWLGPDGTSIPLEGIVPDIEVKISEEDAEAEKDPQMDKAVEILK